MIAYKQNKRFTLIALILVIGAIFFCGTAYAAEDSPSQTLLTVKEVWLTGDTLHISVAEDGGEVQTLELNLRDYAMPGDEYVTIQATDSSGRESNTITFKNPYYQQTTETEQSTQTGSETEKPSESAVSGNPFTPDGTGTVVDNATDGDGKEFFTVETPDGNVFYLIVDRQRDSDNVYLLNAVNEDDLASLAKSGDGKPVSAVQTPPQTTTPEPTQPTTEPTPEPTPQKNGNDNSMLIFIGVAVVVIGGAAYYIKIVHPKQGGAGTADYDEPDDDYDDDKEYDMDSDDEDGDGE